MSALVAQLGVATLSLVIGWIALWPVRRELGAATYHLAALPVGLLAWPIAGSVSSATRQPLHAPAVAVGAVLLVIGFWVIRRLTRGESAQPQAPVSPASFLAALGVLWGFGAIFTALRLTVTNNDSVMSYWPLGVALFRDGDFTANLISVRATLLPSANAGHVMFGSQWAYAIFPLFAVNLLLYLGVSLVGGPLKGSTRAVRTVVLGGVALFLLTEPSFLFQSAFVHSHMITALYLMLALGELWAGISPTGEAAEKPVRTAHLLVAGASVAGIVLARPDGPAYAFVPIVVAIALLTRDRVDAREAAAFFAPILYVTYGTFLGAYLRLGMWGSAKLSGKIALVILFGLGIAATGPWIVAWLDRHLPFRVAGESFLRLAALGGAILLAAVFVIKPESAQLSALNAGLNLFWGEGGYWHLWYAVVAVLLLSIVTADARRSQSWTHSAFLTILVFLLGLSIIHAVGHSGRIGPGDSLNRVMFHILPLVAWYAGAIAGRILGAPAVAAPPS